MKDTVKKSAIAATGLSAKWRVTKEYWLLRSYKDLNDESKFMVDEMRAFVEDFREAKPDKYWHRKSGLVVLSVVLIKYQGQLRCVRGINSELSLPSGSVCAERAAISSALSLYLSLNRTDFLSIAVLAPNNANPIKPCGVCCEWIRKIEAVSPKFSIVTFTSVDMDEILEYSSVTVSEEVIDTVPEHLRGNWICRCGFELNRAQQAFCSVCKQFRFRFKSHLQANRVLVLRAVKRESYPDDPELSPDPPTCQPSPIQTRSLMPSEEETEGEPQPMEPIASSEQTKSGNRGRRRSHLYINPIYTEELMQITSLPAHVVEKTIRDLLSLKFIEKQIEDQKHIGTYVITSLGSDFLEASQKV